MSGLVVRQLFSSLTGFVFLGSALDGLYDVSESVVHRSFLSQGVWISGECFGKPGASRETSGSRSEFWVVIVDGTLVLATVLILCFLLISFIIIFVFEILFGVVLCFGLETG